MAHLANVAKSLGILLLLIPVTIAEPDGSNGSITVQTNPAQQDTTQLPAQYGTVITSLCVYLCNCPANPATDTDTNQIDCGSLGIGSMPQWNSTTDMKVPNYLSISFEYNRMTKINSINTSHVIESISFRGNQIDEIEGFAFQNLPNMKSLSLADNTLYKIDHQIFRTTADKNLRLEFLDLSDNYIVHIDDDAFEQLQNLKELILNSNPLHALDVSTIVSLNSIHTLEKLHLKSTMLKELPVTSLINPMRNLRELDISYNLFRSVPETLQSAVQLKKLNLDGNDQIRELTAMDFIGLISLEELNINNMATLRTIYPETFSPMTKLVTLSCSNNSQLSHIATESFIDHNGEGPRNIEVLSLNNNSLTSLNQETFIHLSEAKMQFNDNKLDCSCRLKWMQSKYGELRCKTPPTLTNQQLKDVDFNNVPCETDETIEGSHIGLALGIALVAIALLGALIFIIIRKRNSKSYPNAHYTRAKDNEACDLNGEY